jgi:hypothetical protein
MADSFAGSCELQREGVVGEERGRDEGGRKEEREIERDRERPRRVEL